MSLVARLEDMVKPEECDHTYLRFDGYWNTSKFANPAYTCCSIVPGVNWCGNSFSGSKYTNLYPFGVTYNNGKDYVHMYSRTQEQAKKVLDIVRNNCDNFRSEKRGK